MTASFARGDRVTVRHETGIVETGTVFEVGPNDPNVTVRFDDGTFLAVPAGRVTRHVASTTTRQAVEVTAGQVVRIADGPKAGHEGRVDTVRHCVQMGSLIPLIILDFADGSRSVRAASSPVEVLS